jgi:predicted DNA-binding transcriptional regulator YafY
MSDSVHAIPSLDCGAPLNGHSVGCVGRRAGVSLPLAPCAGFQSGFLLARPDQPLLAQAAIPDKIESKQVDESKAKGRPRVEYSQAMRLIELYDRANRGEVLLPSSDLADTLGIDLRTLQRDVAALRNLGKLVQADGPRGGWHVPKAERNWGVNVWVVLATALGSRMIGFIAGRAVAGQVQPLLSMLRRSLSPADQINLDELEQRLHVTESGQKLYREQPDLMHGLEGMVDGLLRQRPVHLTYLSPSRKAQGAAPRSLTVQALCLVIHRGAVYFVVDVLSGELRGDTRRILLALDRLSRVQVDAGARPCTYPSDFNPGEFFQPAFGIHRGEESHQVRLRIDAAYSSAVRERTWHATQQLEESPDGSVVLTMQLGSLDEVTDWVLGMGEHVCVEGPKALIERVRTRLERALARYKPAP